MLVYKIMLEPGEKDEKQAAQFVKGDTVEVSEEEWLSRKKGTSVGYFKGEGKIGTVTQAIEGHDRLNPVMVQWEGKGAMHLLYFAYQLQKVSKPAGGGKRKKHKKRKIISRKRSSRKRTSRKSRRRRRR